jgi:Flp pilus assembly protein TadB
MVLNERTTFPPRARLSALAILAALAVVLALHLAIGLSEVVLFGLVGGLVGSLVVVGLDLLRNAQRAIERSLPGPADTEETGEVGR